MLRRRPCLQSDETTNAVFVYTEKLKTQLQPLLFRDFCDIFLESVKYCKKHEREHQIFKRFQILLREIPNWSSTKINSFTVKYRNKIPSLQSLITAIFVGEAKVLSKMKVSGRSKGAKLQLKIPTLDRFLHNILIHAAEAVFYDPDLFDNEIPPAKRKENIITLYTLFEDAVDTSIVNILPIDDVLKDTLGGEDQQGYDVFDDDDEPEQHEQLDEPEQLDDPVSDFGSDFDDYFDDDDGDDDNDNEEEEQQQEPEQQDADKEEEDDEDDILPDEEEEEEDIKDLGDKDKPDVLRL